MKVTHRLHLSAHTVVDYPARILRRVPFEPSYFIVSPYNLAVSDSCLYIYGKCIADVSRPFSKFMRAIENARDARANFKQSRDRRWLALFREAMADTRCWRDAIINS